MRYLMIAVFSAMLVAPLVGCESHSTDKTTHNPLTGSTTHTHESGVQGND